jgi:hypothetical protein
VKVFTQIQSTNIILNQFNFERRNRYENINKKTAKATKRMRKQFDWKKPKKDAI